MSEAAAAFAAIGHEGRLEIVHLSLQKEAREGLAAGVIVERLKGRQTSVSNQLKVLAQAKVATPERRGRQIFYRVSVDALDTLSPISRPEENRSRGGIER